MDWTTNPDGTVTGRCQTPYCPHEVLKPPTGRAPRYCSDACKMKAYRHRKYEAELAQRREEARAYRLLQEQRARDEHARIEQSVREVVGLALAGMPTNSRVSTAQRLALVETVVRSLFLADLIDTRSVS